MKRKLFGAIILAGMTPGLLGQKSVSNDQGTPQSTTLAPKGIDINDRSGNVAMKGNAEIQSEIAISLLDHSISGVQSRVTDDEIELSGNVASKRDKELAHAIGEAYADGRRVRDHIKEGSSAQK